MVQLVRLDFGKSCCGECVDFFFSGSYGAGDSPYRKLVSFFIVFII